MFLEILKEISKITSGHSKAPCGSKGHNNLSRFLQLWAFISGNLILRHTKKIFSAIGGIRQCNMPTINCGERS